MKKVITLVLSLVVIYLIFFNKKSGDNTTKPVFSSQKIKLIKPQIGSKDKNSANPIAKKIDSSTTIASKTIQGKKVITIEQRMKESKKVVDTFTEEAKIVVPSMPNMNFTHIDIANDDVHIVQGQTQGTNRSLTVVASRGVITPDKALQFLKDEGHLIPDFGKDGLPLAQKAYTIPSLPERGFTKNHTVFIGKPNRSGITTNGILMTRADGKGTYLYLLRTHQDFFDANEGLMDRLYEEISLTDQKSDKK